MVGHSQGSLEVSRIGIHPELLSVEEEAQIIDALSNLS